ncbi:MAG: hypothetical protein ACYC4L_14735 [Chloroflexota bacterium]
MRLTSRLMGKISPSRPSHPAKPGNTRPALGELPEGWKAAEEAGELTPLDDSALATALGIGTALEADLPLIRHHIEQNPGLDQAYCWLARHYALRERFGEGRQVLAEGLARCDRRRRLCQIYGWLELETGRLNEAVTWWLRAARLQLAVRQLDGKEPLLYLGYVAAYYGLTERARQLFALVDKSHHSRLSESGKEELRALLEKAEKRPIVEGISALGRCLDEYQ